MSVVRVSQLFQTPRVWGKAKDWQGQRAHERISDPTRVGRGELLKMLLMAWSYFRPHACGERSTAGALDKQPLGFQTPRVWGEVCGTDERRA